MLQNGSLCEKINAKLKFDSDPFEGKRPNNVEMVRGVVSVNGIQFTLQDDSTILADAIIFCTGYLLEFPFLDDRSGIVIEGKKIRPLFQDSLNVEHPSMIIIGLPATTYQADLYYDQVLVWFRIADLGLRKTMNLIVYYLPCFR